MERELRGDVLGEKVWNALDITARGVLASAENLFRERRSDPSYDLASVLTGFAKALEIQTHAVPRGVLPSLPKRARLANVDGSTVSLDEREPLSLGQLARAITERDLTAALNATLGDKGWFTGSLPPILDDLRNARNPAVHSGRTDRNTATGWRNRMLGIGTDGIFVRLGRIAGR